MNSWVVLTGIAGLSNNLFNFIGRKSMKDGDSTAFLWWFTVFKLGVFLILLVFDYWINLSLFNLLILLGLGLVEIVSLYLFGKMHALTELSISQIIIRLRLIYLPIIGWLFLGERFSLQEYAGMGLIFIGLAAAAFSKKMKIDRGVKLVFLFSMAVTLLSVLMKKAAETASTPVVMIFMALPTIMVLPLLMKQAKARIIKTYKSKIKDILIFTFFSTIAMYLLTDALRVGPVSKVISIYQSMLVVAVILGIVFLRERERIGYKLAGALLTAGGVLLLV